MATPTELLVFGLLEKDLAVLTAVSGQHGSALRFVHDPGEFARQAVTCRPLAVFLGVGAASAGYLDVIPVIRAVRCDLPIIVIGEEDSLELERSAREKSIFYYLLHPIEKTEVEAVLKDVQRFAEG